MNNDMRRNVSCLVVTPWLIITFILFISYHSTERERASPFDSAAACDDSACLGFAASMRVTVQPRLQTETWSLYWKESMNTKTDCLDATHVEVDDGATVAQLKAKAAQQLGWQPEDELLRLDGFSDPWERALYRGRLMTGDAKLAEACAKDESPVITFVRIELVAEGEHAACGTT